MKANRKTEGVEKSGHPTTFFCYFAIYFAIFLICKRKSKNIMKRHLKTCIFFIVWVISVSFLLHDSPYASRKLESLGKKIPAGCIPKSDSIFSCHNVIQTKKLIVRYNDQNKISHLGISLFSQNVKEMINEPVCNFLERIMLELAQQKNGDALNQKLNEYGISIEKKGVGYKTTVFQSVVPLLHEMVKPIKFDLRQEGKIMIAVWSFENGETVSMTFPASRELIFGTDKKESDEDLYYQIPPSRCKERLTTDYISENKALVRVADSDLLLEKGAEFMLPKLNSHIYLKTRDGITTAVNHPDYPLESLHNLLIIGVLKSSLKVNVQHKMYGGFTPEFLINLNDLLCFFQEDFEAYGNVEEKSNGKIEATVVFHSKEFHYIHLLILTTDHQTIFQKNGVVSGEFFTNIPQDNIKNLFR